MPGKSKQPSVEKAQDATAASGETADAGSSTQAGDAEFAEAAAPADGDAAGAARGRSDGATSGERSSGAGGSGAEGAAGESASAKRSRRLGAGGPFSGLVPKLAIIVAVFASLIAGALWWQYRQFYVELSSDDQRLLSALEETRAYARRLQDELDATRDLIAEGALSVDLLEGEVEPLPAELRALERRVEALAGGQLDARESWLREQAEYYLVLANAELNLGGRVASAIGALESADNVLRELADPSLGDVRAAIASELQSLRAVAQPDLERLVFDLGGLIERAAELPLRASSPENFGATDEDLEDVEPGLGRLWARTKGAVTSIVRIERQEEPVAQALTESEGRLVRRQLELELQVARTAVLDKRSADFRLSLVTADSILNRDFNRESQSVIEARRLLGNMMQIELEPALPDIGDSLALLRAAAGAR